jgi:hypothetical protein
MCANITNYSDNLPEAVCEADTIDKDGLARDALEFPSEFKVNN